MADRILEHINPEFFTSQVRVDGLTYPFIELDNGDGFIGYGHSDQRGFANDLLQYWQETDPEGSYDDPIGLVEHEYAVVIEESDGFKRVESELPEGHVNEDHPYTVPVTVLWN